MPLPCALNAGMRRSSKMDTANYPIGSVKEFIQWCDELCLQHQYMELPVEHKLCKECWGKIKERVNKQEVK